MRLNNFEIENIKKQAIRHFGNEVKVILFGSRTQNEKRGGDIDLYIKSTDLETMNPRSKINFITDLLMIIGEQKIDVILDNPEYRDSPFFKTIEQTGIVL
ncbi:MAG: nucleotidyltransferase domain-containing protein [Bacteroidota bacterium]